jgi:aminoglycoside phosphotransferase (APT) family kinase protein
MARDLERLVSALRRWLPDGESLEAVVPLSAGHSNETYLLTGVDRILRTPPSEAGLLPPYDMARQFRIMDRMGQAPDGPPVPRMRELCEDPAVIGDAFFTMDRVRGEAYEAYEMPEWVERADAALRSAMCEQWVDAVAAVHAQPVALVGDAPRTPAEEAEHWRRVAEQAESPAELVDLLARLSDALPPISGPVTPLHGDAKLGNCLWQGGRLTALLDWEMAGVGEPLVDVGYLLWTFESYRSADPPGWWTREQVIARWQERTGRTAQGVARFEVLGMAKVIAILAAGAHLVSSGRSRDARFGAWGAIVPKLTAAATARLKEADAREPHA